MRKNTVKHLEIERYTHEIFEQLCDYLGVSIHTMSNFMLVKGIVSFIETAENKDVFSEDAMLHIYAMDSSLEINLLDEIKRNALKKMIEGMLEILNKE